MQLVHAQARKLGEAHVHNGLRLKGVEVEALLEVGLGVGRRLAATNDVYYLVDVVAGNDEAFEDMGAFLSFLQIKLCATYRHLMTVLHEVFHTILESKQTRTSLDERNAIDCK